MRNRWLDIADADYVGHMSSAVVQQRSALSRLMREVVALVQPRTMLVLGGSTGNGLEHIDPAVTSHVTVIDINPAYLRRLEAARHAGLMLTGRRTEPLPSGKAFDVLRFARSPATG